MQKKVSSIFCLAGVKLRVFLEGNNWAGHELSRKNGAGQELSRVELIAFLAGKNGAGQELSRVKLRAFVARQKWGGANKKI